MDIQAIIYILYYYLFFWAVNSLAYIGVARGMRRWKLVTGGFDAEKIWGRLMKVSGVFGALRLFIGLMALTLYALDGISPLTTVIVLGMSSLLLNTVFITGEGVLLNREARVIEEIANTTEGADLLREAIRTFEQLRRTVKNA